jgi:hypothetical protein
MDTLEMAFRLALFLCLLVFAPLVAAESLYTGQVPVASQSDQDTAAGLSAALGQVLAKVTGDAAVLTRPGVAKVVAQPNRYVQQYQFTQDVFAGGQPPVRLTLVAQFDHAAIDRILADLGLARTGGAGGDAEPSTPVVDMRPQTFRVWISGMNSATDYARAIGALARNELVRSVEPEAARSDGVQVRVEINGPLQRLLDSLGSGPLRVSNAAPPVQGIDALLGIQPQ